MEKERWFGNNQIYHEIDILFLIQYFLIIWHLILYQNIYNMTYSGGLQTNY